MDALGETQGGGCLYREVGRRPADSEMMADLLTRALGEPDAERLASRTGGLGLPILARLSIEPPEPVDLLDLSLRDEPPWDPSLRTA